MRLILFRHGIAEDAALEQPDADRSLTPEGVRKTRRAAAGLAHIIDRPDALLTSPKLRAAQTARIVGEAWSMEPCVLDALAEGPADTLRDALVSRQETCLCLVGHEPTLSDLAMLLTGGGWLKLKKAGVIVLDVPVFSRTATLHMLLPPTVLRGLAPTPEG